MQTQPPPSGVGKGSLKPGGSEFRQFVSLRVPVLLLLSYLFWPPPMYPVGEGGTPCPNLDETAKQTPGNAQM